MKSTLIVIGVLIIAGAGIFYFLNSDDNIENENSNTNQTTTNQTTVDTNVNAAEEVAEDEQVLGPLTMTELALHNKASDCWLLINSEIYNTTPWISQHPGGSERIIRNCGLDATEDFTTQDGQGAHSSQALDALASLSLGPLEENTIVEPMINLMASLNDVTEGDSYGTATASFLDGQYKLSATFENLPDPSGTDFYEGWVVRSSPLDVVSTGQVQPVNGVYTNSFNSNIDLTDHEQYILTIEPDDDDPAPAGHVLEGIFI